MKMMTKMQFLTIAVAMMKMVMMVKQLIIYQKMKKL